MASSNRNDYFIPKYLKINQRVKVSNATNFKLISIECHTMPSDTVVALARASFTLRAGPSVGVTYEG